MRTVPIFLAIAVQFFAPAVLAQHVKTSPCTIEDSKRAFDAVDKLDGWGAVVNFYNEYLPCDDGGIAEGVSDSVTKFLANNWTGFWRLNPTVRTKPQFQQFVVRHIDATVSVEALKSIGRNARNRCPEESAALCKKIGNAASSAIKESGH
ncbi:MAG: hypothetical protein WAM78_01580 [Candidatus Sulfotelmatobacter sp.]